MNQSTLKEKATKGLFWGSISGGVQQFLSLFVGVVFARILNQDDYGLIGVLAVFMAVSAVIQDGGFSIGLINRKEIKQEDYNAVFWFSFTTGLCIYLILFLLAPIIALFFKDPRLVNLSRVLFLWIPISSLGIASGALLRKELKLKEKAKVDIFSFIFSNGMGIGVILLGYQYWGIVIQNVANGIAVTTLLWYYSSWRPNFSFNFRPLKEMFPFSIKLVLSNFMSQINGNILMIFFGHLYIKQDIGDYVQGNKWATLSSLFINNIVQGIALPVFVETHNDPERQRKIFRKIIRFTAFISFPSILGLAFVAPDLIVIFLTDKWSSSVFFMQLVCIWGAFLPITTLYTQLILAYGKSNVYLWNIIIMGLTQIVTLLVIYPLGIRAMVIGFFIINFIWLGIWHYFGGYKLINLRIGDVLKDILPYLFITFFVLGCSYFISRSIENIYLRCTMKIAVSIILYASIMWCTNSVIFKESIFFILKWRKKVTWGKN